MSSNPLMPVGARREVGSIGVSPRVFSTVVAMRRRGGTTLLPAYLQRPCPRGRTRGLLGQAVLPGQAGQIDAPALGPAAADPPFPVGVPDDLGGVGGNVAHLVLDPEMRGLDRQENVGSVEDVLVAVARADEEVGLVAAPDDERRFGRPAVLARARVGEDGTALLPRRQVV